MAKAKSEIPADCLAHYDALVVGFDDVARKGVTSPYTSHNGHMFSYLSKEGEMGLRLPAEERAQFLNKYDARLFEQHGAVMKEYVAVPAALLENTVEISRYFSIAFEHIQTLKPKPTKNSRKA